MEKKVNVEKSLIKFANLVSQPKVKYSIMIIFLLVFSFIVQYFVNRPNFGTFLSSDMDPSSNVYILGVDENKDLYKVTKVSPSGATIFQINLEKSDDKSAYVYSNLEVDSKGNFYFVKQKKNLSAPAADKSLYPTLSETVLMYDTNGNYIKQIAATDFSKDANPPTEPYIRKIQIVEQKLTILTCENNTYSIITADPLTNESPRKIKSFTVETKAATTSQSYEWVSDMSVLSTGRIYYSTLNGELYATNNEGTFENCSNILSKKPFQIVGMSVDSNDNLYFSDCVNGKFYKLNTQSGMLQSLYDLDSGLSTGLNVKMKDVRTIKTISADDYYAASKAFDRAYHVRFGTNENRIVADLRGALFPWGYLIMLGIMVAGAALYFGFKFLLKTEITRIPLAVRITAMFLPAFFISMGVLIFVNTSDGVKEYMSVLATNQERVAKTAANIINGSEFSNLNHISGYMNSDYLKIKDELQQGYKEASLNIGDTSDYLVTYIESYGKLYTTINTKYSVNSSSYDKLKYTSPDMIPLNYALVDYLLEEDENEAIYKAWATLSDTKNTEESYHANFRDVYGNISASFVPIKDSKGAVVGMVGNFLDEDIHTTREFTQIFKHSSALIIVITVLIGIFACFVIAWCLRPLKKIEKAIDNMSKGKWDTRIRISTKDELADVAQTFNLMSEKIERYTSNLIKLNKEYLRYVPQEIFRLIDKEKITQVELHSHKVVKMNVVYISFNVSCKGCFDFEKENEVFNAVNRSYEELFKVVENNNGIVQTFTGLDAIIFFPGSFIDALSASIQFKEVDLPEAIKNRMNITLGSGEVLIGVSGNEDRRGVIAISDEIMQLFNIDSRLKMLGINHVATGNIINSLSENIPFTYRYIGRAASPVDTDSEDIYQIIDGTENKYAKDLYLSTKETFESGIRLFMNAEFEKARKAFAEVLRVNEKDKVSIKYLMLCDEELDKLEKNPGAGKYFTGCII